MSLSHDEIRGLLAAFALGAVPPDEEAAIEAHLDDCVTCRAELAALVEATIALETPRAESDHRTLERLIERLRREPPPEADD